MAMAKPETQTDQPWPEQIPREFFLSVLLYPIAWLITK